MLTWLVLKIKMMNGADFTDALRKALISEKM